jgi:hypothetical protein
LVCLEIGIPLHFNKAVGSSGAGAAKAEIDTDDPQRGSGEGRGKNGGIGKCSSNLGQKQLKQNNKITSTSHTLRSAVTLPTVVVASSYLSKFKTNNNYQGQKKN